MSDAKQKNVGQRSVYVSGRTESCVRPGDTFSGRLNQIVDRYLEILRLDREEVRGMFDEGDWKILVRAHKNLPVERMQAIAAIPTLIRDLAKTAPKVCRDVQNMSAGDAFVLLELLEEENVPEKAEADS